MIEEAQCDAVVDTVNDGYNIFVTKIVLKVAFGKPDEVVSSQIFVKFK